MDYSYWLKAKDLKIVKFFPYTTVITYRILSQNHNYKTDCHDYLDKLWNDLEVKAKELGISLDNKIAFKCEIINTFDHKVFFNEKSPIYIGKYDGIVHVGFGVYQPDNWTQQSNKTFEDKPKEEMISYTFHYSWEYSDGSGDGIYEDDDVATFEFPSTYSKSKILAEGKEKCTQACGYCTCKIDMFHET